MVLEVLYYCKLLVLQYNQAAQTMSGAPFLILKTQHSGSQWLALEFNQIPGCSLMFEAEDCPWLENGLVSLRRTTDLILSYLHNCSCTPLCLGCAMVQPHLNASGCTYQERARGLSIGFNLRPLPPTGGMDALIAQSITAIVREEARLAIVLHTRANLVKLAFSSIRTGCRGQSNHVFVNSSAGESPNERNSPLRHRRAIHISPEYLLRRSLEHARDQANLRSYAHSLAKLSVHGKIVHEIIYENLQRNGASAELSNLLNAVDPHGNTSWHPDVSTPGVHSVKSGAEDMRENLLNFAEVSAYFAAAAEKAPPLSCLQRMLLDPGVASSSHSLLSSFQACESAVQDAQSHAFALKHSHGSSETLC